jgi:hypothetical protein
MTDEQNTELAKLLKDYFPGAADSLIVLAAKSLAKFDAPDAKAAVDGHRQTEMFLSIPKLTMAADGIVSARNRDARISNAKKTHDRITAERNLADERLRQRRAALDRIPADDIEKLRQRVIDSRPDEEAKKIFARMNPRTNAMMLTLILLEAGAVLA